MPRRTYIISVLCTVLVKQFTADNFRGVRERVFLHDRPVVFRPSERPDFGPSSGSESELLLASYLHS